MRLIKENRSHKPFILEAPTFSFPQKRQTIYLPCLARPATRLFVSAVWGWTSTTFPEFADEMSQLDMNDETRVPYDPRSTFPPIVSPVILLGPPQCSKPRKLTEMWMERLYGRKCLMRLTLSSTQSCAITLIGCVFVPLHAPCWIRWPIQGPDFAPIRRNCPNGYNRFIFFFGQKWNVYRHTHHTHSPILHLLSHHPLKFPSSRQNVKNVFWGRWRNFWLSWFTRRETGGEKDVFPGPF